MTTHRQAQRAGLLLGPVIFVLFLVLPAPPGLGIDGWRTAAAAVLMAIWWLTEAIPISATAILPLALFPLLGVLDATDAAAPYGNDLIFLFMGGFFLAVTVEKWGLHQRIALRIISVVGTSPPRIVLGFMIASAFLSMWISNTAATAMMLPIALAIGEMFRRQDDDGPYDFGIALMLGLAYAASIGGVATLIGTPPNAVLAAAASEVLGRQIGFLQWMAVGLPVTCVMLPIAWLLLTRVVFAPGDLRGDASSIIASARAGLGRPVLGEKLTGAIFALTALGWLLRSEKSIGGLTVPGIETFAPQVRDSTIAVMAAVALFITPSNWRRGEFLLDWKTARTIPWGVLVLVGGGLSLARAMDRSGLAAWIGSSVGAFEALPSLVVVSFVATLVVFLTELTSNVATASMAMPVLAGAAVGLGIPALDLMTTAALAASMAFMLPVATPPNAIVFGSGYVTISQMSRAGFLLNLCAIVVVTIVSTVLVPFFLLR